LRSAAFRFSGMSRGTVTNFNIFWVAMRVVLGRIQTREPHTRPCSQNKVKCYDLFGK
jgi:hypothetical protein